MEDGEDNSVSTPSLVNETELEEEHEQSSVDRDEGPDSLEDEESEDQFDDDWEQVSSSDSYEDGAEGLISTSRVIAVGLPSDLVAESGIPMATSQSVTYSDSGDDRDEGELAHQQDEETARPRQSESDAHQEAISEVVAESLAEREHNEKIGVQKPPPGPFATMTPRTTTLGSSEKDQLMEEGGFPAPADLERGETSGSIAKRSLQSAEDDDGEEIEADVGIPVGMPGAFAIGGIESDRATGWESDFEEEQEQETAQEDSGELRPPPQDVPERGPVDVTGDQQGPILGVLSNRDLLRSEEQEGDEAVVLEILPASESMPGLWGRLFRIALAAVLVVIAIVVSVVLVSRDSSSPTDPPDNSGWDLVGDAIVGPIDDNVEYGNAVSLASDGNRVAVGAPGWKRDVTTRNVGQSRVLDWTGTDWIVSIEVEGPNAEARAGSSISLSNNGSRVAIGAPLWQNDRGQVVVYEEKSDGWTVVGSELLGNETNSGKFGSSVALSSSGDILVVGSPTSDGAVGENSGVVRAFFSEVGSSWSQLGSSIEGGAASDQFGWSVASCADGQLIVSGAPGSDLLGGGTGDFTGQVRILSLKGTEWAQIGQDIYGTAPEDRFGHSVACSEDGSVIAVGANQNTNQGYVRVFQYRNDTDRWEQMGEDVMGDDNFDSFGFSVTLSSDGKSLAAGSPLNDSVDRDAGQVQVFDYDDEAQSWGQVERDISGMSIGDRLGWSVSLSATGDRVACGAPFSDFDGRVINVGSVEVYDRESIVIDETSSS